MANSRLAKGVYANAIVTLNKQGGVESVVAGQRTPKQLASSVTQPARSFATAYQNTANTTLFVSGWGTTSGSSVAKIICKIGPANPPVTTIWQNDITATVSAGSAGFQFFVPPGYWYEVDVTGAITGVGGWNEMAMTLA